MFLAILRYPGIHYFLEISIRRGFLWHFLVSGFTPFCNRCAKVACHWLKSQNVLTGFRTESTHFRTTLVTRKVLIWVQALRFCNIHEAQKSGLRSVYAISGGVTKGLTAKLDGDSFGFSAEVLGLEPR